MSQSPEEMQSLLNIVQEVYESLPFNAYLGFKVSVLKQDTAGFEFSMKEELIGNTVHGVLHGGVISAVLDATGGMAATASAVERVMGLSKDVIKNWTAKVGTIV